MGGLALESGSGNITLSGLARELGLAKSTVSRALNGYPDIAQSTQERVRAAAQRCGYRPSSSAQNLKRGRVNTIGVVLTDDGPGLANPFFASFLRGVTSALDQLGFDLLVAAADPNEGWVATYDRLIGARKVDGFILTRTQTRDPRVDFLRHRGIPFVVHGRTAQASQLAWIDMNNFEAFRLATERLAEFGHSRIGFIGATTDLNFARDRLNGHLAARDALGLERDDALILNTGLSAGDGSRGVRTLMSLDRPPTAILCIRDEVALGALAACRGMGLRVGQDVSVIGYDGVPHGEHSDPPLTTFAQDSDSAGRRVAEMAAALIGGASVSGLQEMRMPELVCRASDGPAARTPEEVRSIVGRAPDNK